MTPTITNTHISERIRDYSALQGRLGCLKADIAECRTFLSRFEASINKDSGSPASMAIPGELVVDTAARLGQLLLDLRTQTKAGETLASWLTDQGFGAVVEGLTEDQNQLS